MVDAGFLWGVSISSHQNEGSAPESDWTHAENRGRFPAAAGVGTRFRTLYRQDLDRVAGELGANAFRHSIEWARLEPRPGHWDAHEVQYLHGLFRAMRDRGLSVVATLQHYTTPQWLHEGGIRVGWEHPRAAAAFERYADFVAREFGEYIDYYVTFNEPVVMLLGGYFAGRVPPFRWGPFSFAHAARVVLEAHGRAYEAIHAARPGAMVSFSDYSGLVPLLPGLGLDYTPARLWSQLVAKELHPDGTRRVRHLDYLCLHYYGMIPLIELNVFPLRPWNFGAAPEHFTRLIEAYWKAYGLPILIGENGFATCNHGPRADGWTASRYMVTHVAAVQEAMARGVPVLGYFWWTLTDNFEWGSYDARFGLYRVDCSSGDFARVPTPAVATYRAITEAGGVTEGLRAQHA